jgi:hypothetical protein
MLVTIDNKFRAVGDLTKLGSGVPAGYENYIVIDTNAGECVAFSANDVFVLQIALRAKGVRLTEDERGLPTFAPMAAEHDQLKDGNWITILNDGETYTALGGSDIAILTAEEKRELDQGAEPHHLEA